MTKALLIHNPAAGRFALSRRRLGALLEQLLVMGISARAEAAGAGRDGSAPDLTDRELLVVHGGDGTVHQAIPWVLEAGVKLAVLPAGTANVLAKELGIPRQPERALRLIAGGRTSRIHVGRARTASGGVHYFHLMAGVGVDGYVISRTSPRLKRALGWASYWWSGLHAFRSIPLTPFRVSLDGDSYEATFAVVSNCRYYGGQLLMAPGADVRDRCLDVCLFTSRDRWRLPAYLAGALGGRHVRLRDVVYRKASRALIEGDAAIPVQMDGDLMEQLPLEFTTSERSIEVFVP